MPTRSLVSLSSLAPKSKCAYRSNPRDVCLTCQRRLQAASVPAIKSYSTPARSQTFISASASRSAAWRTKAHFRASQSSRNFSLTVWPPQSRRNSTLSTSPTPQQTTSVNSTPRVPPELSALYESLRELESHATNFVNLGRLKLAIRSLEDNGVTRVGILALKHDSDKNSSLETVARDLAGVILADVLSDKQQWERSLEHTESKAILIRSGSMLEAKDANSVFRTIYADSPLLKAHNIEILVSTLDIDVAKTVPDSGGNIAQEGLLDSILVPRLEASASSAGGYSSVAYPIHKALLIGYSTDDILALGLYARTIGITSIPPQLVKVAIDNHQLAQIQHQASKTPDDAIVKANASITSAIDVLGAREAVASIRASTHNATLYQHGWEASRVADIVDWVSNTPKAESRFSDTLKVYIADLLGATSAQITRAEADAQGQTRLESIPDTTIQSISKAVDVWAESGHRELRDSLDLAFTSKQWHKLSWWKLSWRVDEVGIILEELLGRSWLPYAEKGMIFLAGRVQETGLLRRKAWETSIQANQSPTLSQGSGNNLLQSQQVLEKPSVAPNVLLSEFPDESRDTTFTALDIPYPQHIPAARRSLIQLTVPDMHALAQRLVLTNLSTTVLTSALSALYYVSFPLTTLYEAGAFAALGLVFGLKRMQNQWKRAQEDWQLAVRDEGRRALMATEGSIRSIVAKGGAPAVDNVLTKEIEDAKLLVAEAQLALDSIEIKA